MGIAKKGLTFAAVTFGLALNASAATYVAADNSAESKLCVTAATANKMRMHNEVRTFRANTSKGTIGKSYRLIANQLYCNGVDIAEFAASAGNQQVADKLMKYRDNDVQIRDIAKISHGTVVVGGSK